MSLDSDSPIPDTTLYVDHFSSESNNDSSCSSRFPFHPRLPRNRLHSWRKIHSDSLSSNFNFDTFLPLADFSHPPILGRPVCSSLQVVPRDDHSFLNSKNLLDTKPDFNVGLVLESSAVCLLPTKRPPDLLDPQIPTFLNKSTNDVLPITW